MDKSKFTKPIMLSEAKIKDSFFGKMIDNVRTDMIPYQWNALNDKVEGAEPSYCMQNFKIASQITKGERPADAKFGGWVFQDSDFAKWIEAVAYSLSNYPDENLEKLADEAIELVASVSQEDGYMNTYYIINGLENRFTNLEDNHELYVLGHMIEGAVAYYSVTGKDKLLNAVKKSVDCAMEHIGPEEGKLHGYPGHEIIEMALIRLYELTKEEKYKDYASYFIDERGKAPLYFDEEVKKGYHTFPWKNSVFGYKYYQCDRPVREQKQPQGHAVRATYLYSGMVDVARVTEDDELLECCNTIFDNIADKQMYITGAIGQSAHGESFTYEYDLPNDTVYAETCAAIGLVFFARRMLETCVKGKYADVMERALYNGVISGMALDGKSFFYVNPLEIVPRASLYDQLRKHVKNVRQKWFGCACCPPNLARLIPSIATYAYTKNDDTLFAHLYLGGEVETDLNGKKVKFTTASEYPWNGLVKTNVSVDEETSFTYAVRIPAWCKNYSIKVCGENADFDIKDGYAYLSRSWQNEDEIEINLDMPVEVVSANPKVRENIGKIAVTRGPIVYCIEEADNGDDLHLIKADVKSEFKASFEEDVLGGVVTVKSKGTRQKVNTDMLYVSFLSEEFEETEIKWIPYFAFANRGEGEMAVWVRK